MSISGRSVKDRIPLIDTDFGELELEYITECITSGWISSQGKYVKEFEEGFGSYCNRKFAVATSNGTCALHLALLTLGIGDGDEVIVPTLTFAATANAVMHAGATPVFVDSDAKSWNIDPDLIEEAITEKTRAIIPVHLYGQPCDMKKIIEIADKFDLRIIEDAAEAHGATIGNNRVGEFGDISCFSFYANKIITTGEGGMCLTDNPDYNNKMRLLRDHGKEPGVYYIHNEVGYNYRMTNLQAAIGVAQLSKIEKYIKKKRN
ncbi:MAG: DegT/DnrJ/EryC1/StrS family aminotransferase [Chloroflexi bacterium]|nr:DegT/DnrJ/EryC1/StrS family aminotransferase [Chloroflexota bacterium]